MAEGKTIPQWAVGLGAGVLFFALQFGFNQFVVSDKESRVQLIAQQREIDALKLTVQNARDVAEKNERDLKATMETQRDRGLRMSLLEERAETSRKQFAEWSERLSVQLGKIETELSIVRERLPARKP